MGAFLGVSFSCPFIYNTEECKAPFFLLSPFFTSFSPTSGGGGGGGGGGAPF